MSGRVMVDSTTTMDIGSVQLLQRDIQTDSLFLFDEINIDGNGNYSFINVPPGVFYLKAIPDASSAYSNYLPTYFPSNLFWYNAVTVNQCDSSQLYRDIWLIDPEMLAGNPDFLLEGTVYENTTNGAQLANIDLLLSNGDGAFYKHAKSDASGKFSFGFLPEGAYAIYVDLWNSQVFNDLPPIVDLAEDVHAICILHDTYLEIADLISDIDEPLAQEIAIFPNPSNGIIEVSFTSKIGLVGTISVFNVQGQFISKKSFQGGSFIRENYVFEPGVYVIQLDEGNSRVMKKVVIF